MITKPNQAITKGRTMHKITILKTDCPNNVTCNSVIDVDGDPDWVVIRGKKIDDAALVAEIPCDPDEGLLRFPRWMWEERSA